MIIREGGHSQAHLYVAKEPETTANMSLEHGDKKHSFDPSYWRTKTWYFFWQIDTSNK